MNDTNMNQEEKHYREKCEEIKQILNTIPLNAQMRTQSKLIINKDKEPVVILFCDFKAVDINNLHSIIAYDMERRRWMDAVCIPDDADPERFAVYAPVEWELTPFLQVRINSVIDYLNKKKAQPEEKFTANIFVGEWDKYHKDDNLIGCYMLFDKWYAKLSFIFVQTENANEAIFYYDWTKHKYYLMDGTDTSDPLKYTMFKIDDCCLYKPKQINMVDTIYALNRYGDCALSIRADCCTEPMTEAELDAMFPNVRQQLEKEAAERYEQ